MNSYKLSQFEKRMLRDVILKTTGFSPDLNDIQVLQTQEGAEIDRASLKERRFDTAQTGRLNGVFNITLLTGVKAIFLMVGDSSVAESEKRFFFPMEGNRDIPEWESLKKQITPTEDGLAFIYSEVKR